VTLKNADPCEVTFTASVEDTWLAVSPGSGTLGSGLTTDLTLTVSSGDSTGNLPIGVFLGVLDVSAVCPKTGKAPLGSPLAVAIQVAVAVPDAGVADAGAVDAGP
jgi:hypothetical protein